MLSWFRSRRLEAKLDRVQATLNTILEKVNVMATDQAAALEDLRAAVAAENGVIDSAIALINGIAQQIAELPANTVLIADLAQTVRQKAAALAGAVNTTPTPVVTPTPTPTPTPTVTTGSSSTPPPIPPIPPKSDPSPT